MASSTCLKVSCAPLTASPKAGATLCGSMAALMPGCRREPIRDPAEVLASYVRTRRNVTLDDLGYPQQVEILERVQALTGTVPPILDARDVLENPRRTLTLLCEALGVAFTDRMLAWPAGRRASDGNWAKHWYQRVERSTGFMPYRPKTAPLPARLRAIADACEPYYQAIYRQRLGSTRTARPGG